MKQNTLAMNESYVQIMYNTKCSNELISFKSFCTLPNDKKKNHSKGKKVIRCSNVTQGMKKVWPYFPFCVVVLSINSSTISIQTKPEIQQ